MNNMHNVELLECTIRDGALGLEDASINNIADIRIKEEERTHLGALIASIGTEIIEIGSIELSHIDKKDFCIYQNIREISRAIPVNKRDDQMVVGLFRGPDTPMEDIPYRDSSLLDGVRVILRYSELRKSLDFCSGLAQQGYKVFIQPMVTMRYSVDELKLIIQYANQMQAYAVYFVDSYGYMMYEDVIRYMEFFDSSLDKNIKIGFHAHNNMNMAFANALSFLNFETERKKILDSTICGMGQGAGNLQTEIITDYLNARAEKNYNYAAVLEACDCVEKYNEKKIWGYSTMRLLPAVHHVAYKYATVLRYTYGMSYMEIERILRVLDQLPGEMRHRYSKENVSILLDIAKRNEAATS